MRQTPPICDYEGSDYQETFWNTGSRAYEDAAEAAALKRILPVQGEHLLELGAGAGRNTPRYNGYQRVTLVDYSRTQLLQARQRLGENPAYRYVAADVYHLPFGENSFDGATMIRTLHHMADAPAALTETRRTLRPEAVFILEFPNKRNLKSILRYMLRRQMWNPFLPEPVEFAALNFDFHPATVRAWLRDCGFIIERQLTVSHFRMGILKRVVPLRLLVALDRLLQPSGSWVQLAPSIFTRARAAGAIPEGTPLQTLFRCPACGHQPLDDTPPVVVCPACGRRYPVEDGIYNFRLEK